MMWRKVTSDGAVLLRQLEEGGTDSDEAAAAKEGVHAMSGGRGRVGQGPGDASVQEVCPSLPDCPHSSHDGARRPWHAGFSRSATWLHCHVCAGARLINDAAEAAERMAQEARYMTIAIDGVPDTRMQPTSSPTAAAPIEAAQPAAADSPVDAGRTTSGLSAEPTTDGGGATADQPRRRRRKAKTGARTLATSSMSDAEISLLEELKDRKDAAQAVFMALERAEQAAAAAAQVNGPFSLYFGQLSAAAEAYPDLWPCPCP